MYGLDRKELICFSKGCSLHTSEGYSLVGAGGGINGREALAAQRWSERAQVGREATPSLSSLKMVTVEERLGNGSAHAHRKLRLSCVHSC